MKKIIFSFFTLALIFACNGKQTDEHSHDHGDGAHQHDGEHNHPDEEEDTHRQEEFTVGQDTVSKTTDHSHNHPEGQSHQH